MGAGMACLLSLRLSYFGACEAQMPVLVQLPLGRFRQGSRHRSPLRDELRGSNLAARTPSNQAKELSAGRPA